VTLPLTVEEVRGIEFFIPFAFNNNSNLSLCFSSSRSFHSIK